jgi:hypothetical protein
VLSYNEETKQVEHKPVVQTFVNYSPTILSITVEGEEKAIGVTPEHPFYVHRASIVDPENWTIKCASLRWEKTL